MLYLLLAVKHCRGSNRLRIYASVHYPNQKHCLLHSAGGGLILHRQDLKTTTTTSQTGSFRVHACSHSQCHHNEAVPVLCPLYCTYRCAELMTQRIWFYLQRLFVVVSVVVVGGAHTVELHHMLVSDFLKTPAFIGWSIRVKQCFNPSACFTASCLIS